MAPILDIGYSENPIVQLIERGINGSSQQTHALLSVEEDDFNKDNEDVSSEEEA